MDSLLEIRRGEEVREYPLTEAVTSLGRDADNHIALPDPLVSRHHARIERHDNGFSITDLGSANGTRVNDAELEPKVPRALHDGDTIRIADFTLIPHLARPVVESSEHLTMVTRPPEPLTMVDQTLMPTPQDKTITFAPRVFPRLIVTTPNESKEIRLERATLVIGRDPTCDVVVDDRVVSRRHAELRRSDGGYEIVDLQSANGLTFQGKRVTSKALADGDVLWITSTVSLAYKTGEPEGVETRAVAQTHDLRKKDVLTIGRTRENDIPLEHPAISRLHARILARGGGYAIEDAGSTNGTFVNGQPLAAGTARPLQPGDTIRVGPIKFVFTPGTLQTTDESRDLRLDALHLNSTADKSVTLLDDISLSIQPREFVAIVGVSGAGKSTLLDALNGFRPARQGQVLVNGTELYRHFDDYRTQIGYVPQDDIIHKDLTVYTALDYAARLRLPADTTREERKQRVTEVIETLHLSERREVPIHRLSGGQRKRASIGVELLTKPGLFFLDEATSGLDPGTESQMMRLLRQLADEGQTVLLITHATKNVLLCDQVAFLARGGRLVYFGPPEKALAYFGVQDFDAIYEKLENEETPEAWAEKFRKSAAFQEFVVRRLQTQYGALMDVRRTDGGEKPRPRNAGKRISSLRQFGILSSRYLNIIRRDRTYLLLLLLIAPVLGAIDLIAWPRSVLDLHDGDSRRTMVMLFLGAIIPFLVGALSSVREIVKEAPIYRRERAVNLKILPYLGSKLWVGLLFALYNAAALLALKLVAVDFSQLGWEGILQLYVTIALAAMSGVVWGLLISAVAPREEQALLLMIVVVVAQMVFSGGILSLSQLGFAGDVLGAVTSSKWTYQALVSAAKVETGQCAGPTLANCQLPGIQAFATDAERAVIARNFNNQYGDVLGADLYASWGALVLIILVVFGLLSLLQKRKDII